jgi:hypothetical protein
VACVGGEERFLWRYLKERGRLENTDMEERIRLKWIYKAYHGSVLPALSWQKIWTICVGSCEESNKKTEDP